MLPRWKLLLDESKRLEKYVHDERMRCRSNIETEVSLRENLLLTANKVKSIMNEVSHDGWVANSNFLVLSLSKTLFSQVSRVCRSGKAVDMANFKKELKILAEDRLSDLHNGCGYQE
eukprot:sb/3476550/